MTNEEIKKEAIKMLETKLVADLNNAKELTMASANLVIDAIFNTQEKHKVSESVTVPSIPEVEPVEPDSAA